MIVAWWTLPPSSFIEIVVLGSKDAIAWDRPNIEVAPCHCRNLKWSVRSVKNFDIELTKAMKLTIFVGSSSIPSPSCWRRPFDGHVYNDVYSSRLIWSAIRRGLLSYEIELNCSSNSSASTEASDRSLQNEWAPAVVHWMTVLGNDVYRLGMSFC